MVVGRLPYRGRGFRRRGMNETAIAVGRGGKGDDYAPSELASPLLGINESVMPKNLKSSDVDTDMNSSYDDGEVNAIFSNVEE
ncbi:hypothetical protein HPP92_028380, partial [Vanilla planifolia]